MTDTQQASGSALGKHRDSKPPVVGDGKKVSTVKKKKKCYFGLHTPSKMPGA